jgi:hypothetical protein
VLPLVIALTLESDRFRVNPSPSIYCVLLRKSPHLSRCHFFINKLEIIIAAAVLGEYED